MQKSISVMILDDHEIVREGMLSLLKKEERISVIGSYSTVASLTKGIKENKPDLVIVDYILGKDDVDGLNLIKRLTTRNPELLILVVSSIDSSTVISLLKRAKVKGFISKGSSLNTLVDGIKKLARGEEFWPESSGIPLTVSPNTSDNSGENMNDLLDALTPKEREVLRCYINGMTVSEISLKFSRSVKTISAQKQSARRKLNIESDRDLFMLSDYI